MNVKDSNLHYYDPIKLTWVPVTTQNGVPIRILGSATPVSGLTNIIVPFCDLAVNNPSMAIAGSGKSTAEATITLPTDLVGHSDWALAIENYLVKEEDFGAPGWLGMRNRDVYVNFYSAIKQFGHDSETSRWIKTLGELLLRPGQVAVIPLYDVLYSEAGSSGPHLKVEGVRVSGTAFPIEDTLPWAYHRLYVRVARL